MRATIKTFAFAAVTMLTAALPAQKPEAPSGKGSRPKGPYADMEKVGELITIGKFTAAERLAQSALTKIPKHAAGWYLLAVACHAQKKKESALAAVKRSIELDPQPAPLILGATLLLPKNKEHATELALKAAKRVTNDTVLLRRVARILLDLRCQKEALPIVKRLSKLNPKDTELLYMQAELALGSRDLEGASQAYKKLLALRLNDPFPSESLAGIEMHRKNKKGAIKWLRASLKIRPSSTPARRRLVRLLKETGAPAKEIADQKKYIEFYEQVRKKRTGKPGRSPAK